MWKCYSLIQFGGSARQCAVSSVNLELNFSCPANETFSIWVAGSCLVNIKKTVIVSHCVLVLLITAQPISPAMLQVEAYSTLLHLH